MANTVSFDCGRSTIELSPCELLAYCVFMALMASCLSLRAGQPGGLKPDFLDELDDDSAMMFKKSVHDGRMMVAVAHSQPNTLGCQGALAFRVQSFYLGLSLSTGFAFPYRWVYALGPDFR
ncbi:predicted protein [Coccidioides posadasii str. Silveira]|uniref:Predicted protein n=1 Tax=Coccidioides posadasii (strain RMSCC 757 / Silveira) TaxID=443226 RepID=E9D1X2_COCPS|nr:predicted protein [Coccidioides posadasii str. Silveira]